MVRDFSKKIEFEVPKPILNQGVKSLGLIDIPRRRWCCLPRSFLPHSPFKGKKGLPTNVWCHTITYSAVHMLQKWAKRTLARTLFRLAKFSENLASLKTLLEERELRYFFLFLQHKYNRSVKVTAVVKPPLALELSQHTHVNEISPQDRCQRLSIASSAVKLTKSTCFIWSTPPGCFY